jgi:hypothetical protein
MGLLIPSEVICAHPCKKTILNPMMPASVKMVVSSPSALSCIKNSLGQKKLLIR